MQRGQGKATPYAVVILRRSGARIKGRYARRKTRRAKDVTPGKINAVLTSHEYRSEDMQPSS